MDSPSIDGRGGKLQFDRTTLRIAIHPCGPPQTNDCSVRPGQSNDTSVAVGIADPLDGVVTNGQHRCDRQVRHADWTFEITRRDGLIPVVSVLVLPRMFDDQPSALPHQNVIGNNNIMDCRSDPRWLDRIASLLTAAEGGLQFSSADRSIIFRHDVHHFVDGHTDVLQPRGAGDAPARCFATGCQTRRRFNNLCLRRHRFHGGP